MTPDEDRGLLLGDGLFETLLWDEGGFVDWEAHLDRLARGCAAVALPAPEPAACAAAARAALAEAGVEGGRAAIRLTWSAGPGGRGLDRPERLRPRLQAAAFPAPIETTPVQLAIVSVVRNSGSPSSRLKTLSYMDNILARSEARGRGADEALMLNERGELACAAAANLFWIERERLFTPALSCGVLDGTVRRRVLDAAPAVGLQPAEVRAAPDAFGAADGVFLTNSLMRLRTVAAIDGRAVAVSDAVGRLAEAVRR